MTRGREAGVGVPGCGEVTIRFEGTLRGYRIAVTERQGTSALLPPPSGGCLLRKGRHGDGDKKLRNVEANAELTFVAVKLETSSSGPRIGEGWGLFSMIRQWIGEIQGPRFPRDPHRDVTRPMSESTPVRRRVPWLASLLVPDLGSSAIIGLSRIWLSTPSLDEVAPCGYAAATIRTVPASRASSTPVVSPLTQICGPLGPRFSFQLGNDFPKRCVRASG